MTSARLVRHSESQKAEQWIGQAGNGDRRPVSAAAKKGTSLAVETEPGVGLRSGLR